MRNNVREKRIIVKVMCLIKHNGKVLINKGYDKVRNETFFRIIGGEVNFGEKAETAIRREIREELNSEIENLRFLTVVENIFTYEGKLGHEVSFLYKGDLSNKEIYRKKEIHVMENAKERFDAEWVPISDILEGKVKLYPTLNYKELFSSSF